MVEEDYVSFETAKLLKEKGFDEPCYMSYHETNKGYDLGHDAGHTNSMFDDLYKKNGVMSYSAPTLQMAMKWLREVHKLSIEPYYDEVLTWVVDIKHIGKHTDMREFETVRENCYKTYEEACEAAIKYCLEKFV